MDIKLTVEKGPDLGALLCLQGQMTAGEWRVLSDAAQVIANYLRCHPSVAEVSYPGLTTDAAYREASCTLRGGFGPYVWVRLADDTSWRRVEASADDPRAQVMQLEKSLSGNDN